MKRIIETSEVLGLVDEAGESCEVVASAGAEFDEDAGCLVVQLQAFLRPTDLLAKERHFRASWLPADEVLKENADVEECHDMAREIFRHWVRRVRESAPSLHHV